MKGRWWQQKLLILSSWWRRTTDIGLRGERRTARYLIDRGYTIWDRNWRTKTGELDIVASRDRTLVFIEVKTRSATAATDFSGQDAITMEKERRIRRLSALWLRAHQDRCQQARIHSYRFDAFIVERLSRRLLWHRWRIHHIERIFESEQTR